MRSTYDSAHAPHSVSRSVFGLSNAGQPRRAAVRHRSARKTTIHAVEAAWGSAGRTGRKTGMPAAHNPKGVDHDAACSPARACLRACAQCSAAAHGPHAEAGRAGPNENVMKSLRHSGSNLRTWLPSLATPWLPQNQDDSRPPMLLHIDRCAEWRAACAREGATRSSTSFQTDRCFCSSS